LIRFAHPFGASCGSLSTLRFGSTRRVTKILQELCGLEITSTQVSRAAAEMDAMLEPWRQRPIRPISHLILDARYEKVRVDGVVRSCAVLTAIGIRRDDGRRMILGVSISLCWPLRRPPFGLPLAGYLAAARFRGRGPVARVPFLAQSARPAHLLLDHQRRP
jgi:hypothetical protein